MVTTAENIATPTRFIDGAALRALLPPAQAVTALEETLLAGFDPETDAARTRVETGFGQFLQMPSTWDGCVGTKLLTITPDNALSGLPVIQGLYALFGGPAQSPLAVLDGIELTNLRTSAVSALGAKLLTAQSRPRVVVFGTGVQAWQHLLTFSSVFSLGEVSIVGRNPQAAAELASRAERELEVAASVADVSAVADADLVVCCTASAEPLFDGGLVQDSAVVIAMGSHSPEHRELDDRILRRSTVVVESRDSALREAGDIIQGLASGAITAPEDLWTLAELVVGARRWLTGHPVVFKTTGMPWQDLSIARAAVIGRPTAGPDLAPRR